MRATLPSLLCVVLILRQYAWAIFLGLRERSQEYLSRRSKSQFVGLYPIHLCEMIC